MQFFSRTTIARITDSDRFHHVVIAVILLNSIVLGLETYRSLYAAHQTLFMRIDLLFLSFFVIEIALRLYGHGWKFFRGGWNWFDFLIVLVSLLPFLGNLSALRALRILRALRLLSVIPEFRDITESLLRAAKGASAVFGILGLLLYVFAVMSSKLFGDHHPELFGNLQTSLLTHVQLMVFDSWGNTVSSVIATTGFPVFWYFLGFSVIVGFVLISMLIGVIVEAKQTVSNEELLREIRSLRKRKND
jgi:voltage-gated sodium channel